MSKRFLTAETLPANAMRVLGAHLDAIAGGLLRARSEPDKGLHEARKSIKKARALLKLLRDADGHFYTAENARLRDLARSVSGARDAAALVEASERLIAARPDRVGELTVLRDGLAARRAKSVVEDGTLRSMIDEGLGQCAQMRRDMDRWILPHEPSKAARLLAKGVRRTLKRARKFLKKADRNGRDEDFHELRKSVKAHWSQMGLLRALWPAATDKRRKRVNDLGERLGAHNDLALLGHVLRSQDLELGNDHRKAVLVIVEREKAKNAARTLKLARTMTKLRPKRLKRRFFKVLAADDPRNDDRPLALGAPHL